MCNAPIAQLVEQLPLKETVVGSNPTGRTKTKSQLERVGIFGFCSAKSGFESESGYPIQKNGSHEQGREIFMSDDE